MESGKKKEQKISRPVLVGENGASRVSYEIDAFHDGLGIAVEVASPRSEKGLDCAAGRFVRDQ